MTMLHIGCGASRIAEFVNIDCRQTPTTDLVAQAWDLSAFGDASVDYIYARHMLEHLSFRDARRALDEWRRVLMDGGIVHVVVPDILFHARQLLGMVACPVRRDQQGHAMAGFYGGQRDVNGGPDIDCHRWGYTPASLERLLVASGFRITGEGIEQLMSMDREPWHINRCAVK